MKKVQILFFFAMFVIGTDTFLVSPLLPHLRVLFQVSKAMSGWLVSAYAIGYACLSLFAGPLSDGRDRKKVMICGMLGFSASTLLCGIAPNFWFMLLFRLTAGISAAFTAPQVWAAIATLFPREQVVKGMGVATGGLAVSQALGVPLGSLLAGHGWYIPFFALGAVSLLLMLFILWMLPAMPGPRQASPQSILRRYRELLDIPQSRKGFLAYFIFQTGNFAAFTYLGTWLVDRFGFQDTGIAMVMVFLGLGNVLGSFLGGSLVRRLGAARILRYGLTALTAMYALLSWGPSVAYVSIGYFAIFAVAGTVFPVMMTRLTSISSQLRGTTSSLASAVMYAATTLGSLTAGCLYVHVGGFLSVCWFTSVCFLLSLALFTTWKHPLPSLEKSTGAL